MIELQLIVGLNLLHVSVYVVYRGEGGGGGIGGGYCAFSVNNYYLQSPCVPICVRVSFFFVTQVLGLLEKVAVITI